MTRWEDSKWWYNLNKNKLKGTLKLKALLLFHSTDLQVRKRLTNQYISTTSMQKPMIHPNFPRRLKLSGGINSYCLPFKTISKKIKLVNESFKRPIQMKLKTLIFMLIESLRMYSIQCQLKILKLKLLTQLLCQLTWLSKKRKD